MIYFLMGFAAGGCAMFLVFLFALWEVKRLTVMGPEDNVEKTEAFFDRLKHKVLGERAEIFEPTPPEVEAMEAVIKENEAKGRDTDLSKL